MLSRLSVIVRKDQQAVQARISECLVQLKSHHDVGADGVLRAYWETLLNALLVHWETGNEEALRTWAVQCGREHIRVGESSAELLHLLHHAAEVIRLHVASRLWRRRPLQLAHGELEASMDVLRRQFLETYENLLQEQQQQLHEWIASIVTAGLPEETLKRIVTATHALSGADYVALCLTVDMPEIGACIVKASDDAEVVVSDEPPAWCSSLAAHMDNGQSICLDDVGPLLHDLNGDEVPSGACLGVALKSENGMIGHLICLHRRHQARFHTHGLKRIESLALHASEAISTSLIHAEMRAHTRLLYTISSQTSLSLQQFRIRLRDNQNRLESLVQHFPDGVLMLGTDYRVVMANPAGRDYLTILTDTSVGQPLSALGSFPIEFLLIAPEEGRRYEVESLAGPSRVFEIEVNVLQTGREADGWLLVLHDVSEKRQVRQHMEQQEHLTDIGQLVAGVAHDFNSLLHGTVGMAQSLEVLDGMPPVAQERLARIVELGKQGSNLVRQMLDFSPAPVNALGSLDLNAFITETGVMLKYVIPKNVYFSFAEAAGSGGAGDRVVRANAEHLRQALMNLVLNAVDAMPNGGKLELGLSRLTWLPGEPTPYSGMPDGEWMVITVSDTGIGIPAEALSHVFESFFTTKSPEKGTGLGLAQVHGIVKQHDGYVQIESQEGAGTMVSIYLPVETDRTAGAQSNMEDALPRGHGEVILLVDDEVIVREGSQALLEYLGYRVLTAENGRYALEAYQAHQHEVDLVLTDMVMPEIDGVELFYRLRALNPEIRIVMMTGYPLGDKRRQLLEQGMVEWVQKPLDLALLAEIMRQGLTR